MQWNCNVVIHVSHIIASYLCNTFWNPKSVRSYLVDIPIFGSNNDLMMTGESKHIVTLNDNKTSCV